MIKTTYRLKIKTKKDTLVFETDSNYILENEIKHWFENYQISYFDVEVFVVEEEKQK